MTRTFLVSLSYSDGVPPDLINDALEIEDALTEKGLDVESVRAWAAPSPAVAFHPMPPSQAPPTI